MIPEQRDHAECHPWIFSDWSKQAAEYLKDLDSRPSEMDLCALADRATLQALIAGAP